MVHQRLISPENLLEGDVATIRCAYGDTVLYPLANVRMEIDGIPIEVEAAVSDTLPLSVLLGGDVPQLKQLLSSSSSLDSPLPISANNAMVVITRAQAKKQLEEEIVRREQEVLSGAKPKLVVDSQQVSTRSSHQSTSAAREIPATLTQDQRRALRKEIGSLQGQTTSISKALEDTLALSAEELQKLQEADMMLGKVRQAAESQDSEYFYHDGLLYRRWIPPGRGEEYGIEQLVLPKACRRAHEIPLAGHLGSDKTRQRILRRFYWPTVFKDIEEFCKCCEICQKASSRKVSPAPLMPLPIITEPFKKVAMDIVGPLPRSRSGNVYILVLCDYATCYPEAVPLRGIDAAHIAEELIKIFARVGMPEEILTDQGSNFTSQLLAEFYRLLHIQSIRTSPYHPQTDGLVERFNQTLKSMLRKAVSSEGKDWDKWIPYLLFAYREVPQASTGFSPFELLYGRNVWGPLDILKESWEASRKSSESVISYVLSTQEKLKGMAELVQENLSKAQGKQKRWYDRNARIREFEPGDPVLVLLPTSSSKLLAQWQGPYQVVRSTGKVNYLVDMHNHRKRRRVFHVNMLKEFKIRQKISSNYLVETTAELQGEEEDIVFWKDGEPSDQPTISDHLKADQKEQLNTLMAEFAQVFQNQPGCTPLVQHKIETGAARPVRLPPYRLPQAYHAEVEQELQEMLAQDIIEVSHSEWAAPIVLVKKKDGGLRLCVDYRRLNGVSVSDAYPMPRIEDMIDQLGEASFITTIDLTCSGLSGPYRVL